MTLTTTPHGLVPQEVWRGLVIQVSGSWCRCGILLEDKCFSSPKKFIRNYILIEKKFFLLEKWKRIKFSSHNMGEKYSIAVLFCSNFFAVENIYDIICTTLTILSLQFRDSKFIRILMQPSPPSISRDLSNLQNWNSVPLNNYSPWPLLLALGNHHSIF